MAETIKIGGELESMATGKIVAVASAILDKLKNKTQELINQENTSGIQTNAEDIANLNSVVASLQQLIDAATITGGTVANAAEVFVAAIAGLNANNVQAALGELNDRTTFPLTKPNPSTFVTQASEIGYNGQPLDEQIDKKPDVRSTEELANAFYIVDENGNVIAKLAGGDIKTKNFDSSQSAPLKMAYDCDFLIADNNGYAIALFKDGHLLTQKFNSLYSVQSLNSDALSDFLVTDTSGNVIVEFKDGHIKTKNFDSSQGGSGGLNYTQIY